MNSKDKFFLDTEGKSIECQIITSLYDEKRKKHYIIYEYVNSPTDEVFVSSFDPEDKEGLLHDIIDEEELEEIKKFLEEYDENE